jgi:hypothetical protein
VKTIFIILISFIAVSCGNNRGLNAKSTVQDTEIITTAESEPTGSALKALLAPSHLVMKNRFHWQNPSNPLDVNDDGYITTGTKDSMGKILVEGDIVLAEAYANSPFDHWVAADELPTMFYDVDGDGYAGAPSDLLEIINFVNAFGGAGFPSSMKIKLNITFADNSDDEDSFAIRYSRFATGPWTLMSLPAQAGTGIRTKDIEVGAGNIFFTVQSVRGGQTSEATPVSQVPKNKQP